MHRIASALIAFTLIAAACGGDSDETAESNDTAASTTTVAPTTTTTAAPTTTEAPTTTAAPTTTEEPASSWVIHDAPGCFCAGGDDYKFMTRAGDPDKVVFFMQGGGACFTAETCEIGGDEQSYSSDITMDLQLAESDADLPGIFDFDNPENPLAGWSVVYMPYCNGDVFLGTRQHAYTDDIVINHTGFTNAMKGVDHLFENFETPSQVLVTGSSAGGVPAPLIGGIVAEHYPDSDVMAMGDGSGGYGRNPAIMTFLASQWGTEGAIPDWPVVEGIDVVTLGAPDLYALAGQQWDHLRLARFDHAFDATQTGFASLFSISGGDGTVLTVLGESEAFIEGEGVDLPVYVAAGDNHTVLMQEEFYDLETNGVRWVDWFADFVDNEPLDDVVCTDCSGTDDAG